MAEDQRDHLHTSWSAARWVYELGPTVGTREKAILAFLAHHVSEKNGDAVWVGQKRVGEALSMSKKTVERGFVELERRGLIERERRFRSDGSRTSDLIYINFDLQGVDLSSGHSQPSDNLTPGYPTKRQSVHDQASDWGGREPQEKPVPTREGDNGSRRHFDLAVKGDASTVSPPPEVRGFKSAGDVFGSIR